MYGKVLLFLLGVLLLPRTASADVAVSLSELHFAGNIFIVIAVETIAFQLLCKKLSGKTPDFLKVALIVTMANIATALLGYLMESAGLPSLHWWNLKRTLTVLGIAFAISVFVEFGIYVPFFRKMNIKTSHLLIFALVGNFVSYSWLAMPLVWQSATYSKSRGNRAANSDVKNAYTAAQAYFKDNPTGSVSKAGVLRAYGFRQTANVAVIPSGTKGNLSIITYHDSGDRTYTVVSDGSITNN
jgi:hypothetical protein